MAKKLGKRITYYHELLLVLFFGILIFLAVDVIYNGQLSGIGEPAGKFGDVGTYQSNVFEYELLDGELVLINKPVGMFGIMDIEIPITDLSPIELNPELGDDTNPPGDCDSNIDDKCKIPFPPQDSDVDVVLEEQCTDISEELEAYQKTLDELLESDDVITIDVSDQLKDAITNLGPNDFADMLSSVPERQHRIAGELWVLQVKKYVKPKIESFLSERIKKLGLPSFIENCFGGGDMSGMGGMSGMPKKTLNIKLNGRAMASDLLTGDGKTISVSLDTPGIGGNPMMVMVDYNVDKKAWMAMASGTIGGTFKYELNFMRMEDGGGMSGMGDMPGDGMGDMGMSHSHMDQIGISVIKIF